MSRWARFGGSWVQVDGGGGGGAASDLYPGPMLPENSVPASSARSTTTATGAASAHTWGSWVEVAASLSADVQAMDIRLMAATNTSLQDSSMLLQVGIGASGAETAWATLGVGYRQGGTFRVPGFIAAGTRVAVRVQAAVASKAFTGLFSFHPARSVTFGAPVTMGASTATSRGITLTAGPAINTKSAWTEIEASTSAAFSALLVMPQWGGTDDLRARDTLLEIGIGAAGSETVLIPDLYVVTVGQEWIDERSPMIYGVDTPAGSRLSARWSRGGTDVVPPDIILLGAPAA